jgi:hypothetical protein
MRAFQICEVGNSQRDLLWRIEMSHAALTIVPILLAACVFGVGCSKDDSADPDLSKPATEDESREDSVTAPEPSLLDPNHWAVVKGNSRHIHESVAESEASLEKDPQGLLAKTHKKFQRIQVLLQMELFDHFEVHLRGISMQGSIHFLDPRLSDVCQRHDDGRHVANADVDR